MWNDEWVLESAIPSFGGVPVPTLGFAFCKVFPAQAGWVLIGLLKHPPRPPSSATPPVEGI
jgi:hypothetical protein